MGFVRTRSPDGAWTRPPLIGAVIGVLAAGAALGAAELAAVASGPGASPLVAVGGAAIDATPEWLKSFAIRTFGEADKLVLLLGMGVVIAAASTLLGAASVRRPLLGVAGLVTFGALGVTAAVTRPANGLADGVPAVVGTVVGIATYTYLRRAADLAGAPPLEDESPRIPGYDRRRFIRASLATAGLAGGATGLGRLLLARAGRERVEGRREHPEGRRRRAADPRRGRAGHRRRHVVHHTERRLLSRGHRPVRSRDRRVDVEPAGARDVAAGGDARLRAVARPTVDRAGRHARVRLERGRRRLRGERAVDRRSAPGPPRGSRRRAGRRPTPVPLRRRVHRGHAHRGRHGRSRRHARRGDERRTAPARTRVPRAHDRAGPVRLRVGNQVARRS